ncbi:hypothetical protein DVH26_32125 [Paenibacillus sp. H1-7]|uniref:hypothetical protein n=1 Tax=Paenibacillus sp. H1-7 TaxID=2282849 RepID=UPI001EF755BA|nr:hypothetical protein [Paenibacillus sp. H1-7]ULL18693.1 hypothetical protein DVH26_32125 [Paenibacillus sp. H1-7]
MPSLTFRPYKLRYAQLIIIVLLSAVLWLTPLSSDAAEPQPPVQVFNVQQEQVVATLPNSDSFREQAAAWLKSVKGLSARHNVEAESGIVVHIPLTPPLPVNHSWLSIQATDIYLFIDPAEKQNPHLLVFSSEGKPYVFDCPSDPESFLKQHGLLEYLK